MSKRLLNQEEALRKIEISLKLQGKAFTEQYIDCDHCKFSWENNGSRPSRWSPEIWDWTTGKYIPNPTPKPEKAGWHCVKYVNCPYHAYLRFNVVRTNEDGKEVPRGSMWYPVPLNPGEKDTLVLRAAGTKYRHKICRRFESSGRK